MAWLMKPFRGLLKSIQGTESTESDASQTLHNNEINEDFQLQSQNEQLNNGNEHTENVNCRYENLLEDIHDAIQYISTWEDCLGNEPCLLKSATELYRFYEDLRRDLKDNANSWLYKKYCERIADVYFDVAACFNDELFQADKINDDSIKEHLDKCSENFLDCRYEDAVEDLENDTVNSHQSVQLPQTNKLIANNNENLSTVLDYSNQDSSNQLNNDGKKITSQNIQLLRKINTLEAAISMPRIKIHYQTAIQYGCLEVAYKLAGEPILSAKYAKKAKDIMSKWEDSTPQNCENKKEKIREMIHSSLQNDGIHLNDIISSIETTFRRSPLNFTDLVFIEDTYMDICSNLLLEEVQRTLTKFIDQNKKHKIREIFENLSSKKIENFDKIPSPFCESKPYKLLKENIKLITRKQERNLLICFKRECCEKVIACTKNGELELKSLEALASFLSKTECLKSVIKEIKVEKLCRGNIPWSEVMKNILDLDASSYGEELIILQKSIKRLNLKDELFFIEEFKKLAKDYFLPVEAKINNRAIIEIKARNINLSDHLDEIESKISENPDISEVRCIGTDIVHVERDLKNAIWHGKNIIIKTKILKVHEKVTWDVSGKDNNYKYSTDAGTDRDGNGEDGNDGYAGESGGNVLILTENIENPQHLTIISNGGRGSKGQDGGNGINGKDGKGISNERFNEEFPAFNSIWRIFTVRDSIERIKNNMKKVSISFDSKPNANGEFIHSKLADGKKITFCFYSNTNAYLLYEGSEGKPGGDGGEFGSGGEGGKNGEIKIKNPVTQDSFNIEIIAKYGEDGQNGKGGLYGKHGLNGWDMAFTDRLLTGYTQFFGVTKRSKLKVEHFTECQNERGCVWCSHRNKYMIIKEIPIEHKQLQTYEQRKNIRKNTDRKRHAQAKRKKNICEQTVLDEYSDSGHFIHREVIQNLQSDLKNSLELALEMISDNQKQEEEITTEVSVRRQVQFYQEKRRNTNFIRVSSTQTADFERIYEKLTDPKTFLMNWQLLKLVPLNLSQWKKINQIFNNTIIAHERVDSSELSNIENLLKEKYLYAKLQEISAKMTFKNEIIPPRLTSVQAERYLIESNVGDETFSHPELGRLSQYLFEDDKQKRTQLITFCKDKFHEEKCDDFLESIKSFVLEVGNKKKTQLIIKEVYNKYKSLYMNVIYETFIDELSHSRNKHLYDLWMRTMEDKCLEAKFEKEIQNDRDVFLRKLYNGHKIQKMRHWHWCFQNEEIRKAYYNYMENSGLSSRAYWDLLGYTFEVNIRQYAYDQEKRILLLDEFCTSAMNCIHVLHKAYGLISLKIDEKYLNLEERRIYEDKEHGEILKEVEQLTTKTEVENYFKEKQFCLFEETSENKGNYLWYAVGFFRETTKAIKQQGYEIIKSQYNGQESQNKHNTVSANVKSPKNERDYDEDQLIMKIAAYFSEGKGEIEKRLRKLKFQYTGQKGILISLFRQFSYEGRHVSYSEICYLVNAVLSSSVENRRESNIFAWIITAYSQRNWTDQVTLLQLENHFRCPLGDKAKWQQHLSKIGNKDILLLLSSKLEQGNTDSEQCVDETLYLLSNIPDEVVALGDLQLSEWPHALKDKYWSHKLRNIFKCQKSNADLQKASYYIMSMENAFGAKLAKHLFLVISQNKENISLSTFIEILSNFYSERWNLTTDKIEKLSSTKITKWKEEMQQKFYSDDKDQNISKLVELVNENKNTSKNIRDNLEMIESDVQSIFIDSYKLNNKRVCDFTKDDVHKWISSISKDSGNIEKDILAVIDSVVHIKKGFKLRDTQKLTVLTLLRNKKSILTQVSTGEGKSLIVVAASIIKALRGETVDIVTSSSVLAERDAENHNDIYSAFNITVGHNCSENKENRREAYSKNQVVYGDLSSFQRDYLLDKFYDENILGDRQFKTVIVDEVDSMLLDQGNNMLYLSHDLENFDKLESLYIYIWRWINTPTRTREQLSQVVNPQEIKKAVLNDIYDAISMEDLAKLDSDLKKNQQEVIWKRLVDSGIIKQDGKILIQSADDLSQKLKHLDMQQDFACCNDRLHFLLKERIEREKRIHVPYHLRSFIEIHLDKWIENAITAMCMQVDHDYVLDVDRTGNSLDCSPNIIILDRDTGTDQSNSQWEEGLHQFLQLKHGCKVSLQSLKAVFISNVSFFKLYDKLYGLTGTLGSQCERDLLKQIHEVDFVTIPMSKLKQFNEVPPIVCTSSTEWIETIIKSAREIAENRSVLIICETVDGVKQLKKAFHGKKIENIRTYTRDYEEFKMDNNGLLKGQIIIATNLAGRGTDIKISDELKENGGLHVCLTYLPKNIRIEQQAFGRTARSGDNGSGQLIIYDVSRFPNSFSKIFDLKKKRDCDEHHRISKIRNHYQTQIRSEELCFDEFKKQYERFKKKLAENNTPKEIKDILLRSCLDKWAFWLDTNGKSITENNSESLLNIFISQLTQLYNDIPLPLPTSTLYAWVEENPVQTTNLAKYLAQNKKVDDAIDLFNEVIRNEPHFSDAAHYYKAFALTKRGNWSECESEFKRELLEAARLFERHIQTAILASSVIRKMKQTNNELIPIDSFEEQKRNVCNIYSMFLTSIADILGHHISAKDFVCERLKIKDDFAERFYEKLCDDGYLRKPTVNDNVNERDLKSICYGYGLDVKKLKEFLLSYKGGEISEKDFQKDFKKHIQLPTREAFWKELFKNNVLSDEVKLVVIENEKLDEFDSRLLESFEKQHLKINEDELVLYPEIIGYQDENKRIFRKDDFKKTIGEQKYELLKRRGLFTKNKKARFDLDKCAVVNFACYDSIGLEDIKNRIGINEDDAGRILNKLVSENVLVENESRYSLQISFELIKGIKIDFCSLYENSVKELLVHCFSYRIYLQMIEQHIKCKTEKLHPFLSIKPHQSLITKLLAMKIIIPSTINSTKDVKLLLKSTENKSTKDKRYKYIVDILDKRYKYIVDILESKRGILETLENVNGSLQNILEIVHISSYVEASIFNLDGLEHIVKLEEKKWAWKMIVSSCAVTLMGIGQVVVGCLLEYITSFSLTSFATFFINEGISDIVYILGCWKSGFFSWADYGKHKITSVMMSALLVGTTMVTTVFGSKLFGSAVNNVESQVSKQIAKRCALKIMRASACGAANMIIRASVPSALQSLSDEITKSVLSDIENKVTNHSVMDTIKEAVNRLGVEKTEEIIQIATERVSNKQASSSCFDLSMQQLSNTLSKGFSDSIAKYSKLNATAVVSATDDIVNDVLAYIKSLLPNCNPGSILTGFVDEVQDSLIPELKEARRLNKWSELGEDSEELKLKIIYQWIARTREELSRILLTRVINPVLNIGAHHLYGYIEKQNKNTYDSYLEIGQEDEFARIKRKYQKTESIPEEKKEEQIEKMYLQELLNLTKQKLDPGFFANIIRENVPMDKGFVNATIRVVHTVLNQIGSEIGTLKFVVKDENGLSQEFTSMQNGTEEKCIRIDLQSNHFYISRNEEEVLTNFKNNCLFDSLCKEINSLETIKPLEFRSLMASCIEDNRDIHCHLKKVWRRTPIDSVVYGGAKEGTESIEHPEKRREELMEDGVSQSQDSSSGTTNKSIHCHLPGSIFNNEKQLHYCNELLNLLDRSQNVRKRVNMASGFGQNIDKIQHDLMRIAAEIDYMKSFDDIFEAKIIHIRNKIVLAENEVNNIEKRTVSKQGRREPDNACKNNNNFDTKKPLRVIQEKVRKNVKFNFTSKIKKKLFM